MLPGSKNTSVGMHHWVRIGRIKEGHISHEDTPDLTLRVLVD